MTKLNPLLHKPDRSFPKSIAIIGAGTIGPDIGYYLKSAIDDLTLYLVDVSQEALDRARQRFVGYTRKAIERGKLSAERGERIVQGLHLTLVYEDIRDVDWVLEAATEDVNLKHRIFQRVEELIRPEAIITSNTSSLPAASIFANLRHKGRATVTHFFAPAWRNPIVEVIRWNEADPSLVHDLNYFFCMTGKVPLITEDVPCFMLDRVFDNWCNDAAHLLGVATAAEIDSVAAEFVHAGPFFVLNLANGNPIIVETNTLQAQEEGAHYRPAPIFSSVGRWKTVEGGKRISVDQEKARTIRDRLLGVLLSQTADILDRKIGTAADLELGCKLALGFKQGPLEVFRGAGDSEMNRIAMRLREERPGMPLPRGRMADYQRFERNVLVDDVGGVRVITIRRPEAMNALHDDLTNEILATIRACENEPAIKGFVITGYGTRAFCAGADVGRFPQVLGNADAAAQYARDCSRLLMHLDHMQKPVVAALNGMALGGGLELALRCASIVAVDTAWMQFPEITLGIVAGIGAMVVPYRKWPQAADTFHAMLRQAEVIDAATAHRLGIIDQLTHDQTSLLDAAIRRVEALAGRGPRRFDGTIQVAKLEAIQPVANTGLPLSAEVISIMDRAIMDAAAADTLEAALEVGYVAFGVSACTAAAREGIESFLQRRSPDFTKTG